MKCGWPAHSWVHYSDAAAAFLSLAGMTSSSASRFRVAGVFAVVFSALHLAKAQTDTKL